MTSLITYILQWCLHCTLRYLGGFRKTPTPSVTGLYHREKTCKCYILQYGLFAACSCRFYFYRGMRRTDVSGLVPSPLWLLKCATRRPPPLLSSVSPKSRPDPGQIWTSKSPRGWTLFQSASPLTYMPFQPHFREPNKLKNSVLFRIWCLFVF